MSKGKEGGDADVGEVDDFADLEVDGDAADDVGLLPAVASVHEQVDHVEEGLSGGEGDVAGVVLAVGDGHAGGGDEALGCGDLGGGPVGVGIRRWGSGCCPSRLRPP